jgi:two-component system OmpR family sensor kinase
MAAAVCVLAAGAAAMAGASGLVARGYLMGQADSQLRAYADHLTGHPFVATPWSGPAPGALGAGAPGGAVSIEVRGAAGQLVMREGEENRAGQAIPVVSAGVAGRAGRLATVAADGGSWRVIAEPIHYRARRLPFTYNTQDVSVLITSRARPGLDGTLVAGLDVASIGQATGRLLVTGLTVSGMVILAISCLGAAVIRAILRPVAQVEQTVPGSPAGAVDTALSQTEEQALAARAEAEAAARRSAEQMRQLIAGTAHELRRPLSIINGAAAWYRHRAQPGARDFDRVMRQVTSQAARIEALVDELTTGNDQPPLPLPPARGSAANSGTGNGPASPSAQKD